jgi:hypothetical protein
LFSLAHAARASSCVAKRTVPKPLHVLMRVTQEDLSVSAVSFVYLSWRAVPGSRIAAAAGCLGRL